MEEDRPASSAEPPVPAEPAIPAQPAVPAQRAGDADRELIADRLRAAGSDGRLDFDELEERLTKAFTARTIPDLQALVADLGPGSELTGAVPARPPAPAGPESKWTVAVMGGAERKGAWRPSAEGTSVSVMGGAEIDFNDAQLVHPVTKLRVFTVMGGAEIRVPDDAIVHVSKFALMGGHDVELGTAEPKPGAPEIHLQLFSIMGGIEVRRGRKPVRDRVKELKDRRKKHLERRDERRQEHLDRLAERRQRHDARHGRGAVAAVDLGKPGSGHGEPGPDARQS